MCVAKNTLEEMDRQVQSINRLLRRLVVDQLSYANLHQSSPIFQARDKVFQNVRPKRSSLELRNFKKLAFKYYGPFEVLPRRR